MTREEAKEILQALKFIVDFENYSDRVEIAIGMGIEALEEQRPQGMWEHWGSPFSDDSIANSIVCSLCKARYVEIEDEVFNFCPNCGASMSANDRQVTGKLNSETEYKAKVKELEDAIAKCERAEKEFKSRTCKFRSQINCDFCAFHSECEENWKEGDENESDHL